MSPLSINTKRTDTETPLLSNDKDQKDPSSLNIQNVNSTGDLPATPKNASNSIDLSSPSIHEVNVNGGGKKEVKSEKPNRHSKRQSDAHCYTYNTAADGACFFRSILAYQQNDPLWLEVRPLSKVYDWINENREIFSLSIIDAIGTLNLENRFQAEYNALLGYLEHANVANAECLHRFSNDLLNMTMQDGQFVLWNSRAVNALLNAHFKYNFSEKFIVRFIEGIFNLLADRLNAPIHQEGETYIKRVGSRETGHHYCLVSKQAIFGEAYPSICIKSQQRFPCEMVSEIRVGKPSRNKAERKALQAIKDELTRAEMNYKEGSKELLLKCAMPKSYLNKVMKLTDEADLCMAIFHEKINVFNLEETVEGLIYKYGESSRDIIEAMLERRILESTKSNDTSKWAYREEATIPMYPNELIPLNLSPVNRIWSEYEFITLERKLSAFDREDAKEDGFQHFRSNEQYCYYQHPKTKEVIKIRSEESFDKNKIDKVADLITHQAQRMEQRESKTVTQHRYITQHPTEKNRVTVNQETVILKQLVTIRTVIEPSSSDLSSYISNEIDSTPNIENKTLLFEEIMTDEMRSKFETDGTIIHEQGEPKISLGDVLGNIRCNFRPFVVAKGFESTYEAQLSYESARGDVGHPDFNEERKLTDPRRWAGVLLQGADALANMGKEAMAARNIYPYANSKSNKTQDQSSNNLFFQPKKNEDTPKRKEPSLQQSSQVKFKSKNSNLGMIGCAGMLSSNPIVRGASAVLCFSSLLIDPVDTAGEVQSRYQLSISAFRSKKTGIEKLINDFLSFTDGNNIYGAKEYARNNKKRLLNKYKISIRNKYSARQENEKLLKLEEWLKVSFDDVLIEYSSAENLPELVSKLLNLDDPVDIVKAENFLKHRHQLIAPYLNSHIFLMLSQDDRTEARRKITQWSPVNVDYRSELPKLEIPTSGFLLALAEFGSKPEDSRKLVEALLDMRNDEDISSAKEFLKLNKDTIIPRYLNSLSVEGEKYKEISRIIIENFIGGMSFTDVLKKSVNSNGINLISMLLTLKQKAAVQNAESFIRINPGMVERYLKSELFNNLKNAEQEEIKAKIELWRGDISFLDVIARYSVSSDGLHVDILLHLIGAEDIKKAQQYLQQNPILVTQYQDSAFLQEVNSSVREERLNKLKQWIEITSFKEITTRHGVNDDSIIGLLLNLSTDYSKYKAKNIHALESAGLENYLFTHDAYDIERAQLFFSNNPALVKEYAANNPIIKTSNKHQQEKIEKLKDWFKHGNRINFHNGIIGASLFEVFEQSSPSIVLNPESLSPNVKNTNNLSMANVFLSDLKSKGIDLKFSDISILKSFIKDAASRQFTLGDEVIDDSIEMFHILNKLEAIMKYTFKRDDNDGFLKYMRNQISEENYESLMVSSMVLKQIDTLKDGVNTCDVEALIMPVSQLDMLINIIASINKVAKSAGFSTLMDLAFRRHFLEIIEERMFEKGHSPTVAFLEGMTTTFTEGPAGAALLNGVYEDILSGKPYCTYTSTEIQAMLLGSKIWNIIFGMIPGVQSVSSLMRLSVEVVKEGEDISPCAFIIPAIEVAMEVVPMPSLSQIKKAGKKIAVKVNKNPAKVALDLSRGTQVNNQIVNHFKTKDYPETHVRHLLHQAQDIDLDVNSRYVLLAESLLVDAKDKINISKLSPEIYAEKASLLRGAHPELFIEKMSTFTNRAEMIQTSLIAKGYREGVLRENIIKHLKLADEHKISSKSAMILLSEHLGLELRDKLSLTELSLENYNKKLTHLFDSNKELIMELALDKLYQVSKDVTYSDAFDEMNTVICRPRRGIGNLSCVSNKATISEIVESYIENNDQKWKSLTSELKVVKIAELAGDLSAKAFSILNAETSTSSVINPLRDSYFKIMGENILSFTDENIGIKPRFITFTRAEGSQLPMNAYVSIDKTTGSKKFYYENIPELDLFLDASKIHTDMSFVELTPEKMAIINDWINKNKINAKLISTKSISGAAEGMKFTDDYVEFTRINNVALEGKTFVITSHGDTGLTFSSSGLMSGSELSKSIQGHFAPLLAKIDAIELRSSQSANGGTWSSQAQVLADKLNLKVIGYEGDIDLAHPLASQKMEFIPAGRSDFRKEMTAYLNSHNAAKIKKKIIKYHPQWNGLTTPSAFSKDNVINTLKISVLSDSDNVKIKSINNLILKDPKIASFVERPSETGELAARKVLSLLKDDSNFEKTKIINMAMWDKYIGNKGEIFDNHWAIASEYQGTSIVIDPIAGQFPLFGNNRGPIIDTADNWKARYQEVFDKEKQTLLKITYVDSFSEAPFTSSNFLSPFHDLASSKVEVLSDSIWYCESGFEAFRNHEVLEGIKRNKNHQKEAELSTNLEKYMTSQQRQWEITSRTGKTLRIATLDGEISLQAWENMEHESGTASQPNAVYEKAMELSGATSHSQLTVDQFDSSQILSFAQERYKTHPSETLYLKVTELNNLKLYGQVRSDLAAKLRTRNIISDSISEFELTNENLKGINEWMKENSYQATASPTNKITAFAESLGIIDNFSDIVRDFSAVVEGHNLIIETHGFESLTVTPKGILDGAELAVYIKETYYSELPYLNMIELKSCQSANGGKWSSQGQLLADKLGIKVKAYYGKFSHGEVDSELSTKAEIFYPRTSSFMSLTESLNRKKGNIAREKILQRHPAWPNAGQ